MVGVMHVTVVPEFGDTGGQIKGECVAYVHFEINYWCFRVTISNDGDAMKLPRLFLGRADLFFSHLC